MPERWLPVAGFDGRYEVSDQGNVRSILRGRVRLLRGTFDRTGYRSFHLRRPGCNLIIRAHRLVAETFIGECPPGHEVRHLDGDKLNNALRNLAYGTRREQRLDDVRNGRHNQARKTHCDNGHPYNAANTRIDHLRNRRACRACRRDRYQRQKAAA